MKLRRIAVVGDDGLDLQLERVVAELLPRPSVVRLAHIDELGAAAADPAGIDAVVVGPSHVRRSLLPLVAAAHDQSPGPAMVLVAEGDPRIPAAALVRTGAIELLRTPADDELRRSVERALEIGAARQPARDTQGPATVDVVPPRVVTVASATGGCGKTFYALNLAYFLAQRAGRRVCVVDLDLQFGEVSTALRLRPQSTIFDLVRSDLNDEELGEQLGDYVIAHESGIHVLAAPKDPAEADEVTPREAMRVIRALRTQFDDVIVDTPTSLSEVVLAAFDVSDELVVMVTPDVPSVRNLHVFLQTLARLKVPSDHIAVVMNKADRNLGIDLDEVQRVIDREFRMVLPYAREVSRSINLGVPVLAYASGSEVSRRLRDGIVASLPAALQARLGPPTGRESHGWFRRLATRGGDVR